MLNLNTPIIKINRVGATVAKRLNKIGIKTIYDLLVYFPFRYDDFRAVTPIDKLKDGQTANIVGQIELIQNKRSPRKRMYITEALVSDNTEQIKVIWFNQPFIAKNLKVGDKVSLTGKVEGGWGQETMRSPAYEKIINEKGVHTQGIVPNYHLTANITQKQIRFLIKQIIDQAEEMKDWLPDKIIKKLKLIKLGRAIKQIHFPKNYEEINSARRRLAFNELFLLQLHSQITKSELKASKSHSIKFMEAETKKFVSSLPFSLTDAQKKAAWAILKDMEKESPMSRLLEGDVGSGKTVIAVIAILNAALNNKQSVLMVPTEILAKQHFDSIVKMLGKKTTVCLLTHSKFLISNFQFSNNEKISKNLIINYIKNGKAKIIIGTHALLQEKIKFKNLALAIVDEQHRFGVQQRKKLINKANPTRLPDGQESEIPHLLSMTATPIPRSLALALYGDLDLSIINEMPKGRKTILTKVVPEEKRKDAYEFIKKQIKDGRQIFVICPLIDFSDKLGVKSVKEEFKKLDTKIFPDIHIGMLHGRMKPKEKELIMRDFLDNKIKILVSTSVVEVGVDVPNACIMMIEGADRFGLAQLHQFRGRVGRGKHQSYCFLFTDTNTEKSLERLRAMETCHDGFALARTDLKFRGPGEVFGTAQKGFPEFKVATLFDYELMTQARDEAIELISEDSQLHKYPKLKDKLLKLNKIAHLE